PRHPLIYPFPYTTLFRSFITLLHIDFPVITYNGAQIYCPKKNKVIYKKRLTISKNFIDFIQNSMSFAEIAIFYDDQVFTLNKGKDRKSTRLNSSNVST